MFAFSATRIPPNPQQCSGLHDEVRVIHIGAFLHCAGSRRQAFSGYGASDAIDYCKGPNLLTTGSALARGQRSERDTSMNSLCEEQVRESKIADRRQSGFVKALRVHHALTSEVEKRVLVWMALRTPSAINSDHLTALGFISQLLAGVAYALASRDSRALWLVNVGLALNWLGDSLDGTLARVRDQQRPRYGFYVDHMADTFGALALMAGLACSGYVHWPIAAGLLAGFYVLSIESYLATYTMGHFHLSHGIFGPTEIRILLMLGNVALMLHPYDNIAGRRFRLFDIGGAMAIAGMACMAVTTTCRHLAVLYREEKVELEVAGA